MMGNYGAPLRGHQGNSVHWDPELSMWRGMAATFSESPGSYIPAQLPDEGKALAEHLGEQLCGQQAQLHPPESLDLGAGKESSGGTQSCLREAAGGPVPRLLL